VNILFIQRNAQIGGGNTYLRVVAPELRRRGHATHLMIGPGPARPELADACATPLALSPEIGRLSSLLLSRLIRSRAVDVVDAHTFKIGLRAAPVCARAGVPLVQHIHSLVPLEQAAPVLQAAARVVVMNRAVFDWVGRVPGVAGKTVLSALPVDLDRYRPGGPSGEGFHVVYCGRLARRKAAYVMSLLEMLPDLVQAIPGLRLTVVGGRSHWREVAAKAAATNQRLGREAVRVIGQVLDPSAEITSADVVVGTGYVALEGLACARHVVGVGIQGLVGLVTEENLQACVDANFGDHAAFDVEVTPQKLRDEVLRAHEAWQWEPCIAWGPRIVAEQFSAKRAADDLERAFG
jgi:hypothetical protein